MTLRLYTGDLLLNSRQNPPTVAVRADDIKKDRKIRAQFQRGFSLLTQLSSAFPGNFEPAVSLKETDRCFSVARVLLLPYKATFTGLFSLVPRSQVSLSLARLVLCLQQTSMAGDDQREDLAHARPNVRAIGQWGGVPARPRSTRELFLRIELPKIRLLSWVLDTVYPAPHTPDIRRSVKNYVCSVYLNTYLSTKATPGLAQFSEPANRHGVS